MSANAYDKDKKAIVNLKCNWYQGGSENVIAVTAKLIVTVNWYIDVSVIANDVTTKVIVPVNCTNVSANADVINNKAIANVKCNWYIDVSVNVSDVNAQSSGGGPKKICWGASPPPPQKNQAETLMYFFTKIHRKCLHKFTACSSQNAGNSVSEGLDV